MKNINKLILQSLLVTTLLIASFFVPPLHNIFEDKKVFAAEINRIAGSSRYETAVSISSSSWQNAENIVLANGLNFPDALAGAPLSYALDAPILLVKKDAIPIATLEEISRLSPKNIYLLGSTGVISDNLADQLKENGYNVKRIAGNSRYTTATAIGEELRLVNSQNTAVLVYGRNYPDALGIGGAASENGWPILFTDTKTLHKDTKQSLTDWGIKNVLIIGGTGVIEETITKEITTMGISVERISGKDRIDTSLKVAEKFYSAAEEVIISTGYNFPDALSGGPLAGKLSSPTLLVRPNRISEEVLDYINTSSAKNITILGGAGAVEDNVSDEISLLYTGNSVGNISNAGIAAIEGDWIYSLNYDSIYKSKIDGTHKTKITGDLGEYINVVGDWIFYSNTNDGRKIYKIKTDGTNKTKVSDYSGSYISVVNDWVYFINYHINNLGVFKVRTDGTDLTKIIDGYIYQMNVVNDWIYFDKNEDERKMYKVKTDGTNLKAIATGSYLYINVVGDWIYYIDEFNKQNIYKMKTNGQNKTKIAEVDTSRLNVSGDWIYFRNNKDSNKIYKVKIDGSSMQKVNNDVWSREINVVGNWIYYKISVSEGDHLYRIKTDGTQRELIAKSLSW